MRVSCSSSGVVKLVDGDGEIYWLPTICKTWKCSTCQRKLLALIQARMQYGMERLGRCLFITVTYVMDGDASLRYAESVASDLKELWKALKKRERWRKLAYVRVPELTRKGQVHVHMIVGGVPTGTPSCRRKKEPLKEWKERGCSVRPVGGLCLQHEVSGVWLGITGDAFVVDVSVVRSGPKTASYITGYIRKDFIGHKALEARGFTRRYAFSRNWPSCGRMELAKTLGDEWKSVTQYPRHYVKRVMPDVQTHVTKGGDVDRLEKVGKNVVHEVFGDPEVSRMKRAMKQVKEIDDGTTVI